MLALDALPVLSRAWDTGRHCIPPTGPHRSPFACKIAYVVMTPRYGISDHHEKIRRDVFGFEPSVRKFANAAMTAFRSTTEHLIKIHRRPWLRFARPFSCKFANFAMPVLSGVAEHPIEIWFGAFGFKPFFCENAKVASANMVRTSRSARERAIEIWFGACVIKPFAREDAQISITASCSRIKHPFKISRSPFFRENANIASTDGICACSGETKHIIEVQLN